MASEIAADVDRWGRELRKGSARLALLTLLRRTESYGYEILTTLREQGAVSQGATEATIYPLLHDLEERGYLRARWANTNNGVPARKYYKITAAGQQYLDGLASEWKRFQNEMKEVLTNA